mgnify:CR=1 FL=1
MLCEGMPRFPVPDRDATRSDGEVEIRKLEIRKVGKLEREQGEFEGLRKARLKRAEVEEHAKPIII